MPSATVTLRELKNKETGLDLNIPTWKEIPGLLTTTAQYNLVVVSRWQCFKSPKHKETDVVQFMIEKHYEEFENLAKQLSASCPSVTLPPLHRSLFGIRDNKEKKRQFAELDKLVDVIAGNLALACSPATLQFLGVERLTAEKFGSQGSGLSLPSKVSHDDDAGPLKTDTLEATPDRGSEDLFGDEEEEDSDDLFVASKFSASTVEGLFSPDDQTSSRTKLFAEQDFGGAVTGEDDDLLKFHQSIHTQHAPETEQLEDNSELLSVDDDLDKILQIGSAMQKKPQVPDKPKIKPKPTSPIKTGSVKPPLAVKPSLKPKPAQKPRQVVGAAVDEHLTGKKPASAEDKHKSAVKEASTASLQTDDILKYIEDNMAKTDDTLDLFS